MSITDELREWGYGFCGSSYEVVNAIADRIDAEHERMLGDWDYWESTHVKLPVDADGEYINIGDMMDSKVDHLFDGRPFEVRALVLCEDGWEAADGRFGNRYEPDSLRHHHAPTVEDVLREFTDAILEWSGKSGTVAEVGTWSDVAAEYAKRLRLVNDEE